jgi:hypothetical protein
LVSIGFLCYTSVAMLAKVSMDCDCKRRFV